MEPSPGSYRLGVIQRRAAFAEQLLSHLVELFRMALVDQSSCHFYPAVQCSDAEQLEKMMEEHGIVVQSGYALIGPHQ